MSLFKNIKPALQPQWQEEQADPEFIAKMQEIFSNFEELPRVLVYSDDSFGEDEVNFIPIDQYTYGFYHEDPNFKPTILHKTALSNSRLHINDEFISYLLDDDTSAFKNDYGYEMSEMKPMLWRDKV